MRRVSWLFLPAAVLVSLATPSRSFAQDDLTKFRTRETAVWESVKAKELESIRKVFDRDYLAVYDAGINGYAQELDGMSKLILRSFQLSDFKLHRIDALNVAVAYTAVVDGEMEGQSVSGTYHALTMWHRRGNQWMVAAHSEVKAKQ